MMDELGRRSFLGRLTAAGLGLGLGHAGGLTAHGARRLNAASPAAPFAPGAQEPDAAVFAAARREFLFPESVTYCNTGTLGASPREVVAALVDGITALERALPDWPYEQADGEPLTGYQPLEAERAEIGAFINAPMPEIALTQNATMGMSFIAAGLELERGDEVVTTDQEHGGGIGPWQLRAQRHGIVVKQLPLDAATARGPEGVVASFAEAITPRTRVLMFSHITSGLGTRMPAEALCALARERGVLSVVDGAQAVGQIEVDVEALGCDAYVASPHKWMLAPKGTGFLHVRSEVQPAIWNTLASSGFDDHASGAFRFMRYGTGSVAVVDGLQAAVRFLDRLGMPRIERWDTALSARLRAGIADIPDAYVSSPADPRFMAGITTFGVRGRTGKELQDALWRQRIRVRAQGGERGVRLSAHVYVAPADIDRVLEVTSALARGARGSG